MGVKVEGTLRSIIATVNCCHRQLLPPSIVATASLCKTTICSLKFQKKNHRESPREAYGTSILTGPATSVHRDCLFAPGPCGSGHSEEE